MKRLLVLFLLLFSVTTFASPDLKYLLKDQRFNLAYGVTLPDTPALTDFSVRYPTSPVIRTFSTEPMTPLTDAFSSWYWSDFAEDPFNGLIELAVVGQPSASTTATLIISLLCGLFLIRKHHARLAQRQSRYLVST